MDDFKYYWRRFWKNIFCRNGIHFWVYRWNFDEAWKECWLCMKEITMTQEEEKKIYKKLKGQK